MLFSKKPIFTGSFLTCITLAMSTAGAVSHSPSTLKGPEMSSESEITYAQILKIIATPKATAKTMSDKIVGKSISLKLIATGPQALMVNREDLIFFICNSKAPGFKAGNVKTKITKFFSPAYGEEGEITITLAECKN